MPRKKLLKIISSSFFLITFFALSGVSRSAGAVDEHGAMRLAKQSGCFKCHTPDKAKEGPAWRDVAAKYKDKPVDESEKRLIQHITTGEIVKFKDGHEEHHKIVKSDDPAEVKNLVDWILSLPGGTYNGSSYDLKE